MTIPWPVKLRFSCKGVASWVPRSRQDVEMRMDPLRNRWLPLPLSSGGGNWSNSGAAWAAIIATLIALAMTPWGRDFLTGFKDRELDAREKQELREQLRVLNEELKRLQ